MSTSLKGKIAFDINRADAEKLPLFRSKRIQGLENSSEDLSYHLESVKHAAKALSGFIPLDCAPEVVFTGAYQREGYSVGKYMLSGEGDYVIPALLMVPDDDGKHPAVIYVRPDGKAV